jgi:pseudouridine synthase
VIERLQKFLSSAGVASRRQAEKLMLEGRVTVNGKAAMEPGIKVDSAKDHVKVDGKLVQTERPTYILLNKPKGTICTMDDPEGRPKVVDLIRGVRARVFPVGRLDFDTTGALLLTNDGELANQLMHPAHKFPKTYVAKVKGVPSTEHLMKLQKGIFIDGKRSAPAEAKILAVKEKNSLLQLVLREGRNKQVKRMCQAIGHVVLRLDRPAYGFLSVEGMQSGEWRHLSEPEVERLKHDVEKSGPRSSAPMPRQPRARRMVLRRPRVKS